MRGPTRPLACIGVVASIALLATGCSAPAGSGGTSEKGRPVVLTTFTVLADIARNVAGDHLDVESITKDGAEIHDYEPTPQDIAKASHADLLLDNGLGLETWFTQFSSSAQAPKVVLTDGIEPIGIADGPRAGEPNPHAWMSPTNVETYVDNMVTAFVALDPQDADDFRSHAQKYKQQLQQVQQTMVEDLSKVPKQEQVLVSCEGAFSYLAKDAGLKELYLWPVNSEEEGTPKQIASVIDAVKADHVPAVFCESTESPKAMQQVVDATGAKLGDTLYVDSLSTADGPVPTYLDLIRHDATTIVDGLTGRKS